MKLMTMAVQTSAAVSAFKSSALTAYKKSYQKRGARDHHEQVFAGLANLVGTPEKVLYPGCHRHITASIVFPNVDYVDCDSKVSDVYHDPVVREWILSETEASSETAHEWTFTSASFTRKLPKLSYESYDLMISLSAGIASTTCTRYIKPGGFFLVNDSHADASTLFANDKDFQLYAAWDDGQWKNCGLEDYFVTTKGSPISKDQASEAAKIGSKSQRSFRLRKESNFCVFQKTISTDGLKDDDEENKEKDATKLRRSKRQKLG